MDVQFRVGQQAAMDPIPFRELSAASAENALDLQKAARLLFKNGYSPAAVAIAVIADEETAKSVLYALAAQDASLLPGLNRVLLNHRAKQYLVAQIAILADVVSPAMRAAVRRHPGPKARSTTERDEDLPRQVQDEFLRVMRARTQRRRTVDDEEAILVAGDIQVKKNNSLYVGLDQDGRVSVPRKVVTRQFAKRYLAALDDRLHFYLYMVIGNMKNGHLSLSAGERRLIKDSWQRLLRRVGLSK